MFDHLRLPTAHIIPRAAEKSKIYSTCSVRTYFKELERSLRIWKAADQICKFTPIASTADNIVQE